VGRLTPNDGTEGNDPDVPVRGEQSPRRGRQLPCARYPNEIDVLERCAVSRQRIDRPFDKALRDRFVEATGHDRETPAVTGGLSNELCHLVLAFL
jgi:hypothetical protein